MGKYRTIPDGYMTVGEVAKKMGVTVRTLQYYDKEGLLSPSAESEGGRRLYKDKDLVMLHQILSLKSLGFSLEAIRQCLTSLDTPTDVANVLTEQAVAVRKQIEQLSSSLIAIEQLKEEVLQIQSVDFKKYADIIVNLQLKNDYYWLIKHFDDQMMDHISNRFNIDDAKEFMNKFSKIQEEAVRLYHAGIPADSDEGQKFAKTYWDMITEFTGGDMNVLGKLMELGQSDMQDTHWQEQQGIAMTYVQQSLDFYFTRLGINPFQEGTE